MKTIEELKPMIKTALEEKLPKDVVKQIKHDRRGIQKDAHAVIAHVIWQYDENLRIRGEFPLEYSLYHHHSNGAIDTAFFCENHHQGLLLAAEIVTDCVEDKDLYKLRDAPVVDGGLRLIIQLNPCIEHIIKQPQALDKHLTDEQMASIDIIEVWRRMYNGLERRRWAQSAKIRQEAQRERQMVWQAG